MTHYRAQLQDIAILVCRLLALYLLVVALGKVSEASLFLRTALTENVVTGRGTTIPFPVPGTNTGPLAPILNNLPQARLVLTLVVFSLLPFAVYLVAARQLWVQAPKLASRMVGNEVEGFDIAQAAATNERSDATGHEENADNLVQEPVARTPESAYQERTWDIRRVVFSGIGLLVVVTNLPPILGAVVYTLSNLIFWTTSPFAFLHHFANIRFVTNLLQVLFGVGLILGMPTVLQLIHRFRLWAQRKPTWAGQ